MTALAALMATACAPPPAPSPEPVLLRIAADYTGYQWANLRARWSPERCAGPILLPPSGRISASTDEGSHGKKLYYLHAKDDLAYERGGEQPVGQVLVKEAWTPKEVADADLPKEEEEAYAKARLSQRKELPAGQALAGLPARRGGKAYAPGTKAELFVMYKLDPRTEGTDVGWVYGTLSADGKTVTSSGRIESCMSCHRDAKTDRIFGLPPASE